ncbi:hypothetical protein GBA52_015134 [Prunus armeniaca]|nr:hypothetical protein GBA52_015134 [Prunus armeniaca]
MPTLVIVKVRTGHFPPPKTEVIGANLSTNPDVIMVKTQQVTQPSRSREFDHEIIDDPSHILDHQVVSLSLKTISIDPRTVR